MIVCVCHCVSDRDIAREAAAGSSFEDLQVDLGVGTRCGACLDCARDTHRRHATGTVTVPVMQVVRAPEPGTAAAAA